MLVLEPLRGQIKPDECSFRVVKLQGGKKSKIELTLVKESPVHWETLEGDQPDGAFPTTTRSFMLKRLQFSPLSPPKRRRQGALKQRQSDIRTGTELRARFLRRKKRSHPRRIRTLEAISRQMNSSSNCMEMRMKILGGPSLRAIKKATAQSSVRTGRRSEKARSKQSLHLAKRRRSGDLLCSDLTVF